MSDHTGKQLHRHHSGHDSHQQHLKQKQSSPHKIRAENARRQRTTSAPQTKLSESMHGAKLNCGTLLSSEVSNKSVDTACCSKPAFNACHLCGFEYGCTGAPFVKSIMEWCYECQRRVFDVCTGVFGTPHQCTVCNKQLVPYSTWSKPPRINTNNFRDVCSRAHSETSLTNKINF